MMNVSTRLEIVSAPLGEPLISDHITNYIMVMLSLMILVFSLPSIVLNSLNVYIFVNTKLDSVTVCFISLALSDMSAMLVLSVNMVLSIIAASGVSWGKNLPVFIYVLSHILVLLTDMSSATTTYIAVQRGLCVAFPFLTRHAFNKNRSLVTCLSFFLVILAFSLPRFSTFSLKTIPDPADNNSQLVVFEYLESWDTFETFHSIFVKTVMVFVEYGTMIVCTVAITIGMRSSTKLKQKSSAHTKSGKYSHGKKNQKNEKNKEETMGSGKDQSQKRKDSKEALVVKQSLVVVLIHVIFTTPRICAYLYQVLEPRFELGGQYHNLFFVFFTAVNFADSVNVFANFFVYVKFNSKFRNHFLTKIYKRKVIAT